MHSAEHDVRGIGNHTKMNNKAMAAIEVRAHKYATKKVGGWYTGGFKGSMWQASYDTYIDVATEQHKIDIEKACEWLSNHSMVDTDLFKKAMEE